MLSVHMKANYLRSSTAIRNKIFYDAASCTFCVENGVLSTRPKLYYALPIWIKEDTFSNMSYYPKKGGKL